MTTLTFRNWQHIRTINLPLLRRMIKALLAEHLQISCADIGIFLVAAPEMTRINENFLQHDGSTDVITFDYSEPKSGKQKHETRLHGEIFVCVEEAIIQSRKFRTTWQSETVRYIVHGILHLLGYDDSLGAPRRKMKLAENKLLHTLTRQFDFRRLDKAH